MASARGVECLAACEALTSLDLSCTDVSDRALAALVLGWEERRAGAGAGEGGGQGGKPPPLRSLNLQRCLFVMNSVLPLAEACSHLERLDLEDSGLLAEADAVRSASASARRYLARLEELGFVREWVKDGGEDGMFVRQCA